MEKKETGIKKPWVKPELIEYGTIDKLTKGASTSAGDGVHVTRK